MKTFPAILLLLAALFLLPSSLDAQGLFGKKDPHSEILRKAKRYNLVSVRQAVPGAYIDMRYKYTSAANKPLYLPDMPCLVHKATGEKLKKVQKILEKQGYALKIWDAWRPPEAHIALWNAVKDPNYVVPPSKGLSWHCYGISIDLTVVKKDGTPVPMPSKFDEFSAKAASQYVGGDPEIAKRVIMIQDAMRSVGFRTIRSEWWHFDDMQAVNSRRHVTAKDLGIRMP